MAELQMPAVRLRRQTEFPLRSKENLDYRIFVSAPAGEPPVGGFPVLYVLDGNAWFGLAAEIARLNELEAGPAIVVGVGYPDDALFNETRRFFDFTSGPTKTPLLAPMGRRYGGADAFLRFLRTTLRDEIAERYAIDRTRQSLFGHSAGGYFALYALFEEPEAFSAYIAASPAIWWDKERLAVGEQRFLSRSGGGSPRILIEVGGNEQAVSDADIAIAGYLSQSDLPPFKGQRVDVIVATMRDQVERLRTVDNARDLSARLNAAGAVAPLVVFEGESHGSVVPAALSRAMPVALAR